MNRLPFFGPHDHRTASEQHPNTTPKPPTRHLPTRSAATWFAFRATCFQLRRALLNAVNPQHRRHARADGLNDAPVVASVSTPLWTSHANAERAQVVGKIENLRVARRAFDGVVLRAGDTLSFWAQLGAPVARRGFVMGRELREGCLIPTLGGGICQLSNALLAAAQAAGLTVVERHAHSQAIPGAEASQGRDATVFWNYVDLRLRTPFDLRLEVAMDAERLHVRLRSWATPPTKAAALPMPVRIQPASATPMGNCASCQQTSCFRNAPQAQTPSATAALDTVTTQTAVLAPVLWLEDRAALAAQGIADAPQLSGAARGVAAWVQRLQLALAARAGQPPAARALVAARAAARRAAAQLTPDHTHVLVDQAWLPFLWQQGALAGRRFQVLMRALPMAHIESTLEQAAARHPAEPTLRDFRAPPALLQAETQALAAADAWISPHAQVLALAGDKARPQPWQMPRPLPPAPRPAASGPLRVYFPASSLVRKGTLELAAALRGLDAVLILPARDGGEPRRWGATPIQRAATVAEALRQAHVVALPAWVEHQPRILLQALAGGVPVIATPACGLGDVGPWRAVPAGDVPALRAALLDVVRKCAEPPGVRAAMVS